MPWLLAIVATVTPPARSAGNAVAGARNRYCLAAGLPRSVTAVSRLTTARSAPASTGWIGASAVAGSASRGRTTPSKCTSPPKASVTAGPCLLYTSDATDEEDSVDLGGRRIIKKKKKKEKQNQ